MKPGLLDLLVCPHDAGALTLERRRPDLRRRPPVRDPRRRSAARARGVRPARRPDRHVRLVLGQVVAGRQRGGPAAVRGPVRLVRRSGSGSATRTACARFLAGQADGARGRHRPRRRRGPLRPPLGRDGRRRSISARASSPPSASSAPPRTCTTSRPTCCARRFPPERFDFVSADQVVHHTPDAAAAVRSLARLLAPGRRPRLLRLQAQGAAARVRGRLHPRAHDEDERRGVHGVQRVHERAGPQALATSARRSRSSATFRCSASRPASTTCSG